MMAILLHATGEVTMELLPAHGAAFTLEELHAFVGGYIEIVRCAQEWMVINEDGKGLGLPVNCTATAMFWLGGGDPADRIVGNAVICSLTELGEGDDEEAE